MEKKTVRFGSRQIRYFDEGAGAPVLLVHGAAPGSSADSFTHNLGPLAAAGLRAIAPDRPGYGDSDGRICANAGEHVQFILDFMDALHLERAMVVGHSQHGGIVARLALEHPERVPRAILVASGGVLPLLPDGRGEREVADRADVEPTVEFVRDIMERQTANHALITPEAVKLRHRMAVQSYHANRTAALAGGGEGRPRALGQTRAQVGGAAIWKDIGEASERFLLLFGRQDRPVIIEQCEFLKSLLPEMNLVLYDQCSHMVHWDQAAAFEREVAAFVSAQDPVTPGV